MIASYKKTTTDAFKQIVPRTAPPITIRGGSEYRTALSDQIQNVLTKQKTPEQAAKALADAWDATTNRIGVAKQVQALKTLNASFPTVDGHPAPSGLRRSVSSEPLAPNPGPAPKRRAGLSRSDKIGAIFVLPGQLLMVFIVLFPALVAIYIGFTEWSPINGTTFWYAYENWHWFARLLARPSRRPSSGTPSGARC